MEGNVGDWIVPVSARKPVKYSYRGGQGRFKKLKDALNNYTGLERRVLESPLGNMYKVMEHYKYSSPEVYHMLVRMVKSEKPDEMLFRFGDTICRFGRPEFGKICGLSFLPGEEVVWAEEKSDDEANEVILPSSLIAEMYPKTNLVDLSGKPIKITTSMIEEKMTSIKDNEELVYKLGLVYLIDAVLYGRPNEKPVASFVIRLVDDTTRFLSYPWGTYFWNASMLNWKWNAKKMAGRKKTIKDMPTDDIFGIVLALVAWGCETLPENVRNAIANRTKIDVPRIMRWRPLNKNRRFNVIEPLFDNMTTGAISYLEPGEDEVTILRAIGMTNDEITTPPPTYHVPTDAPAKHAIAPTSQQSLIGHETTQTGTAGTSQQVPNVPAPPQPSSTGNDKGTTHASPSFLDNGRESEIQRDTVESVGELRQLIDAVLEDCRETRRYVDERVEFLRTEIQELKNENRKEIQEMRNDINKKLDQILNHLTAVGASDGEYMGQAPPPFTNGPEQIQQPYTFCKYDNDTYVDAMLNFDDELEKGNDLFGDSMIWDADNATPTQTNTSLALELPKVRHEKRHVQEDVSLTAAHAKKQKTSKLSAYDVALFRELEVWIRSKDPGTKLVPGIFVDDNQVVKANVDWFKGILKHKESLEADHIDCYFNLLTRRMEAHPKAFLPDCILLYHAFAIAMTAEVWEDDMMPEQLVYIPCWTINTKAYTCWWINAQHWIAVEMSVNDWTMYVYDCFIGTGNLDDLDRKLKLWAGRMRVLFESSPDLKDHPQLVDPFKVVRVSNIPQMTKSGDCGMFAIKYIEAMIRGESIQSVVESRMGMFRKQVATDLFHQVLDV